MSAIPDAGSRYVVGVEVGPVILRAGVFGSDGALKGKVKVSTKLERGAAEVLGRVAKCVRYAVDECDLRPGDIAAVGVAVPGRLVGGGVLGESTALCWKNVNVAGVLAAELDRPVLVGQLYDVGGLGIVGREFSGSVCSRILVLFPGPQICAATLVDGLPVPLVGECGGAFDGAGILENVVAEVPHPLFGGFRGRDFRKALKKVDAGVVRAYAGELARCTGEAASQIAARFAPDLIVLGGGVVDELGEEMIRIARAAFVAAGGKESVGVTWAASALGDLAMISGAAMLARQAPVPGLTGVVPA